MIKLFSSIISFTCLTLTGCAVQGKLIDMGSGEEISLLLTPISNGYAVEGMLEDGSKLKGESREVMSVGQTEIHSPYGKSHGCTKADTLWYGSGYLKAKARVIDFEYYRRPGDFSILGTAKDNLGKNFKLML